EIAPGRAAERILRMHAGAGRGAGEDVVVADRAMRGDEDAIELHALAAGAGETVDVPVVDQLHLRAADEEVAQLAAALAVVGSRGEKHPDGVVGAAEEMPLPGQPVAVAIRLGRPGGDERGAGEHLRI